MNKAVKRQVTTGVRRTMVRRKRRLTLGWCCIFTEQHNWSRAVRWQTSDTLLIHRYGHWNYSTHFLLIWVLVLMLSLFLGFMTITTTNTTPVSFTKLCAKVHVPCGKSYQSVVIGVNDCAGIDDRSMPVRRKIALNSTVMPHPRQWSICQRRVSITPSEWHHYVFHRPR